MDYKKQYEDKITQCEELYLQLNQFQEQSNFIINDLQQEVKQLKKKNENLVKELNDANTKRKNFNSVVQREIQVTKKERNQFKNKFIQFEGKVIELQNINQRQQSDLRATKSKLWEYESTIQKTMEELALLQIQLQDTTSSSKQQITRLKSQLKQTQDQLFVLHNVKHKKEEEVQKSMESQKSIHIQPVDTSVFKSTLTQIRQYLDNLQSKRLSVRQEIYKEFKIETCK